MFSIIKKTANVWHHESNSQTVHLSTFGVVADITAQTFIVRALNGAFFPRQAVLFDEIQVIDETDSGTIETFNNIDELIARLIQLQYPPYKTSGGGGGGAVDSVNGQTGVVVLDADDISDASTAKKFVSASEKTAITHANRSTLDLITEAFTTALKTAYDSAVAWIVANGTNILNHISSTSNPHNVTKAQVGLGNVDNTSDLNKPISTATQTALDGKADDPVVTDISLTSTIVGWSSFTRREITVLDYGACAIIIFALEGTSNNATTNFTIPFSNGGGLTSNYIRITNNGTANNVPGNATISSGASIVVLNVNNTGGVFTGSGGKSVIGEIIIIKNP